MLTTPTMIQRMHRQHWDGGVNKPVSPRRKDGLELLLVLMLQRQVYKDESTLHTFSLLNDTTAALATTRSRLVLKCSHCVYI